MIHWLSAICGHHLESLIGCWPPPFSAADWLPPLFSHTVARELFLEIKVLNIIWRLKARRQDQGYIYQAKSYFHSGNKKKIA